MKKVEVERKKIENLCYRWGQPEHKMKDIKLLAVGLRPFDQRVFYFI